MRSPWTLPLSLILVLCSASLAACDRAAQALSGSAQTPTAEASAEASGTAARSSTTTAKAGSPVRELERPKGIPARLLTQAAKLLPDVWPKDADVIELRVLPDRLEIQGGFVPKQDVAGTPVHEAFLLTLRCEEKCTFSPRVKIGTIGEGQFEENLFPLSSLRFKGLARSLAMAKKAVDPDQGRVVELKARRFLPFSRAVRARYYVDSPLMSGTMDANGRGIPLKR